VLTPTVPFYFIGGYTTEQRIAFRIRVLVVV